MVGSLALVSIVAGIAFVIFRRKRGLGAYKKGSQSDPDNLPELQCISGGVGVVPNNHVKGPGGT